MPGFRVLASTDVAQQVAAPSGWGYLQMRILLPWNGQRKRRVSSASGHPLAIRRPDGLNLCRSGTAVHEPPGVFEIGSLERHI